VKYSIDANSNTGKQIQKAKFGIVIHSRVAEPGADVEPIEGAFSTNVPELFVANQNIKDSVPGLNLDSGMLSKLKAVDSSQIDRLFNPSELRDRRITGFPKLFKQYINSKVRTGNFNNLLKDFVPWINEKMPTQAPRILEWMQANSAGVSALVQSFLLISSIKNGIVRQLDQNAHEISASIDNEPGHEGYVIRLPSGLMLKFVDRMRFSQANFAKNNPEL
jgi:hypothetical protein